MLCLDPHSINKFGPVLLNVRISNLIKMLLCGVELLALRPTLLLHPGLGPEKWSKRDSLRGSSFLKFLGGFLSLV